jgi:hypothetical protein
MERRELKGEWEKNGWMIAQYKVKNWSGAILRNEKA